MGASTFDAINAVARTTAMINLRSDYIQGRIEVEEFEEQVDRLLRGQSRYPRPEPMRRTLDGGAYGVVQIVRY